MSGCQSRKTLVKSDHMMVHCKIKKSMLTNRRQSDSGHNKVLCMSVEIEWSLWLLTQFCRLIRKWLESKGMVVTVRVELLAHGLRMKYPREPKLNFCSVHSSQVLLPQFHPRTYVTTRDDPNHCRRWTMTTVVSDRNCPKQSKKNRNTPRGLNGKSFSASSRRENDRCTWQQVQW